MSLQLVTMRRLPSKNKDELLRTLVMEIDVLESINLVGE